MSRMSDYCKAYHVKRFREYPGWSEREVAGLHMELLDDSEGSANGADSSGGAPIAARPLTDDDILFLHPSYHVTDGVFADEHVVFDDVTPEWRTFCDGVLGFEIPDYARAETVEAVAKDAEAVGTAISSNTTTIAAGA